MAMTEVDCLPTQDALFSSLDNGFSRTCYAPDSRGVDDRFLDATPRPRFGILDMILVAGERQTLSW